MCLQARFRASSWHKCKPASVCAAGGTRGGLLGDRPATARAGGTFGGGGGFGFGGSPGAGGSGRPASAPRERPPGNSAEAIRVRP